MRLIWGGFLMTGLMLVGMSVYERRQAREEYRESLTPTAEGGYPYPTPSPRPYTQQ